MTKLQYTAPAWAAALVAISHLACCAQGGGGRGRRIGAANSAVCRPSSCGDIRNISHPFRLRGDPPDCGDHRYELNCEANRTILEIPPSRFWVKAIGYEDEVIRVIDARAMAGPSFLLSPSEPEIYPDDSQSLFCSTRLTVQLINCSSPVQRDPAIVEANSCMTTTSSHMAGAPAAAAGQETHLYWLGREWTYVSPWFGWGSDGLPRGCRVVGSMRYEGYSFTGKKLPSCSEVRDVLMQGFNMGYCVRYCRHCALKSFTCELDNV